MLGEEREGISGSRGSLCRQASLKTGPEGWWMAGALAEVLESGRGERSGRESGQADGFCRH